MVMTQGFNLVQNFHLQTEVQEERYIQYSLISIVIIFVAHMSSSANVDNKGKDILVLGEGPRQGLNHALIAKTK